MSAGGKGHTQRPTDDKKFQENFDKIFGKKKDENSSSTQRPVAQDGASKETLPPA